MLRSAALALAALLTACAAPEAPPSEAAPAAEASQVIMMDVPAQGPNGAANTDEEWAKAARAQRAEILAAAEGAPEAKARYALMMDCGRYVSDYGIRKYFDDENAGRPKDEACDTRSRTASDAFMTLAEQALPLSEMDQFQYFNSGLILDKQEFLELGDAAAQRAWLQAKAEACFAAPDLPADLPASFLTDCPMASTGEPIAK